MSKVELSGKIRCQEVQMKKTRFTETQIITILKVAESGMLVKDICRKHGISDATYWWMIDYNERRRHDSLEHMTPLEVMKRYAGNSTF